MKKNFRKQSGLRLINRRLSYTMTYSLLALFTTLFLPVSVYSANRLVVQGGSGVTFVATDTGTIGVNVASPNYNFELSGAGVVKSSMHFSKNGTDVGGWITSVLDNNFFLSSGAMYDGSLGGWIQKTSDGNAIVAGSQQTGFEIWTANGTVVGGVVPLTRRFVISAANGYTGIGFTNPLAVPSHVLDVQTGAGVAYVSSGGVWTNASSREYKENIKDLSAEEAVETLKGLNPVKYNYKVNTDDRHVGFIAEDVPDLVATKDRKGLSPMDIVAVLTRVVKEQKQALETLTAAVAKLEAEVNRLKSGDMTVQK